jgi:hypothetical protein
MMNQWKETWHQHGWVLPLQRPLWPGSSCASPESETSLLISLSTSAVPGAGWQWAAIFLGRKVVGVLVPPPSQSTAPVMSPLPVPLGSALECPMSQCLPPPGVLLAERRDRVWGGE